MLLRIFGTILVIIGVLMVLRTDWFLRAIGKIAWAERVIGSTRSFFKLLGVILIFVGLMMIFNLFGGIVYWALGPILPN
jgi:vacuolar-type H+-ATPase subunit I/STV1